MISKFIRLLTWVKEFFSPSKEDLKTMPLKTWPIDWEAFVFKLVEMDLRNFEIAQDIEKIYPNYFKLKDHERARVITTFMREICRHESNFNPACESVDVGVVTDKDTWSVGLFQVSVVDQKNYRLPLEYTYLDLKKPLSNIHLAMEIMLRQCSKRKKFLIPMGESGVYWGTIHPGGKYDKTKEILKVVQSLKF